MARSTHARSARPETPRPAPRGAEVIDAEVLVVGGGLVGMTLASALAGAGIATAVVDREDPAAVQAATFDGRASAVAAGSRRMLESIGLWPEAAAHAQPILDIRVSDGRVGRGASPLFLHYDHGEVGDEPLGHIVENVELRRAQHRHAARLGHLVHLAPLAVDRVERTAGRVEATLADGRRVRARLVAACDGRGSPLRQAAGIRVASWRYGQTAIVATLAHALDHEAVAHEHFLPSGPFAMLPMVDDAAGRHRSSIVWTEKRRLTPAMLALDEARFAAECERRFGDSLGELRLAGPRFAYPLSCQHAERYINRRLALVGDAAHAIHPIAGQGLNLGFRDVAALAEAVVDARRLGLDVGEAPVLERYQRWRRTDNLMLVAATDSLNRLFANDLEPLRLARDAGLAAVNRLPPLKRLFMRHAMGVVGDLPRLVEGRRL